MNDSQNGPTEQTGQTETPRSERQGSRAFDNVADALRKGADEARRAAEKAVPKIKAAAVEAGYRVAYAAAFAAVFEWTVLKQITPECVKSGCREGAKAGKDAAVNWMDKISRREETRPAPLLAEPGPAGDSPQPGVT